MTPGPLAGLTVVALEQAVAAPFATRQLADLGARVIKIERPGDGDFARHYDSSVRGLSSYFVWLNRGKESMALDLGRPAAREILARLLDRADVFVQNVGPGAAVRLGTDAPTLRAHRPRLIVCDVTGYGSSGPYAGRKAYDLLVQHETGLVSITGTPDAPSKAGISVADIAAGMHAHAGILAALVRRGQTGAGAALEVSLFDALAEWMSAQAYLTAGRGRPPARSGAHHASIAPYGPFRTRDGHVCLGIQHAREWTRFTTDVLGQPALAVDPRFATNERRVEHRDDLHAIIDAAFALRATADVLAALDDAGIAAARLNDVPAFLAHPQLADRRRWRDIDTPAGPVAALLPPLQMDDVDPVMGAIPSLGQHTDAILIELGYTGDAIGAWRTDGVLQ